MTSLYLYRRPAIGRMRGPDEWRACVVVRPETRKEGRIVSRRVFADDGTYTDVEEREERSYPGFIIRVDGRERFEYAENVRV